MSQQERTKGQGAAAERQGRATRALILDTTERVMVEEGYAAVSTRRVAQRAGIKAPLIHYHFGTTEALLVAVYRRSAENSLARHAHAMAQNDVLRALWQVNFESERTALALEFLAMANHHKFIAEEIARYAEQIRAIQIVALERHFRGDAAQGISARALTVIVAVIARGLVLEEGVGITLGHAETRALTDGLLRHLSHAVRRSDAA